MTTGAREGALEVEGLARRYGEREVLSGVSLSLQQGSTLVVFGLPGGGRVSMTHLNLPGVPDYTERVTVYCTDRIIELTFPSPYLRHAPTRLTVRQRGKGAPFALETIEHRVSYEEAFREELRAFHAAATSAAPVQTTVEQARRDVELLLSAFQRAAS